MWSKRIHKLFRSRPIREDLNRKWRAGGSNVLHQTSNHNRTGSYVLLLKQRAVQSLKRGIKVIKGMVLSKHWTANPLCNELNCYQHWDLGLWMPSVQSQHSWRWDCYTVHGQSLCLYWNVFDWNVVIKGQRVMVQWQMLGMCSMRRSQSSVVSRPLGLWLSSLAGWATILSKINSAIGRLRTYFKSNWIL